MNKWLLLAVIGLLSACSQSDIEELTTPTGGDAPIFYASVEGADAESRTYLDETGKMRWTHDDRITIFFGENYNREFAFVGATGTTAGSFEQISTDGFYTAEKMAANYAIYPHAAKTILEAEGYFKCTLPATQNYAEGSFGLNANTMVSVTKSVDDRFLQFRNVGGYLKLNLYGANVTVAQITLQGNNNEPLAGAAVVTPTYGGEPMLTWAASGTTQVLTLDCGAGVKIGQTEEEATAFYLVVPPTTFEKGFTVTITDAKGKVCTKSTSNEQTFTRNVTKNMPAFEAKCKAPNPVPSNQIWYTSTNGKIVEPDNTGAFGVAIKSNTYTDGKGVITFEGDVTTIGEDAFYGCTSLASITLPEGVTTIGDEAFWYCTSLASITLPEGVTTIGEYAFDDCRSLASITLPESVTTIVDGAFWGCTSLASITIPEGVTTIGQSAFYHCTSLASITLPEGVTTIGSYAFYGCRSLASVTLPEGVTTIGNEAFSYCTSLASITIPEGVTTIGEGAFGFCTSLASITIPESVTELGAAAFANCSNLRHFEGKYASDNGRCLIKENVLIAFAPAGLTTYTVPEGVTTIEKGTFSYCTNLASITLPEGVTTIGDYAFRACTSLKSVYCKPTTPPTGGYEMFYNNASGRKIYVPASDDDSIINAYKAAEYWSDYAADIVEEAEPTPAANQIWYTSTNGKIVEPDDTNAFGVAIKSNTYTDGKGVITFEGDVTTIGSYAFYDCTSLASITIPEGVTEIKYCAFYGCTSLASITLPEGVTTIGSYAFYHCTSLASITIPEGVTTIGSFAFENCTSLASITLPEGVTTIGSYAFRGCTSLASITLPEGVTTIGQYTFYNCTSLASITIPEGVTTIGESAFFKCESLASITLPEGVTTIGWDAFYYCTSLKSVYCKPTTPPTGGGRYMFYGNASGRKIYVPASDDDSIIKAYKAAEYWNDYAPSIVEYQF